jgi:hypothetical protein
MFAERLFEIAAGTAVVVLASVWLLGKRPQLRAKRPWLALWWVSWLGTAGFSYFALFQAQVALTTAPPDERLTLFALWMDHAATTRLASTVVLVLGLLGVLVAWARAERGERGSAPRGEGR